MSSATNMAPTDDSTPEYRDYYAAHNAPAGQSYWGGAPGGADQDVARYQGLGSGTQPAVQIDQTQTNESRGMQLGALGLLRAQAAGSAPSAADVISQRADQGAAGAMARAGAGARTAGGGVAALRQATPMTAQGALATNAQNAGARAAEISHGQGQYASGAGSVNEQDIGAATANAKLVAQQHAIDQQRQQAYEQMAWNTRNAELQGNEQGHQQFVSQNLANKAAGDAEKAQEWKEGNDAFSGGLGVVKTFTSDPGAKTNIMSIGSLAGLRRRAG